jgi:hypothetical protein
MHPLRPLLQPALAKDCDTALPCFTFLQDAGDLVLRDMYGNITWHTNTAGTAPGQLLLQFDGNLVLNRWARFVLSS